MPRRRAFSRYKFGANKTVRAEKDSQVSNKTDGSEFGTNKTVRVLTAIHFEGGGLRGKLFEAQKAGFS